MPPGPVTLTLTCPRHGVAGFGVVEVDPEGGDVRGGRGGPGLLQRPGRGGRGRPGQADVHVGDGLAGQVIGQVGVGLPFAGVDRGLAGGLVENVAGQAVEEYLRVGGGAGLLGDGEVLVRDLLFGGRIALAGQLVFGRLLLPGGFPADAVQPGIVHDPFVLGAAEGVFGLDVGDGEAEAGAGERIRGVVVGHPDRGKAQGVGFGVHGLDVGRVAFGGGGVLPLVVDPVQGQLGPVGGFGHRLDVLQVPGGHAHPLRGDRQVLRGAGAGQRHAGIGRVQPRQRDRDLDRVGRRAVAGGQRRRGAVQRGRVREFLGQQVRQVSAGQRRVHDVLGIDVLGGENDRVEQPFPGELPGRVHRHQVLFPLPLRAARRMVNQRRVMPAAIAGGGAGGFSGGRCAHRRRDHGENSGGRTQARQKNTPDHENPPGLTGEALRHHFPTESDRY